MTPKSHSFATTGRDYGRRSLRAVVGIAIVAVAVASVSTASAATRLSMSAQPDVPFPVRVYALSLPGTRTPSVVRVTENGRRVQASLTPIGRKRVPFSAVLLLDSSLTMIGAPLVAARTAATTLIRYKLPRSELAIVGFSAKPYAVHDFSRSKLPLTASLSTLRTRYGTAVWDSVILASRLVRTRKGSAKAIVILTDGRADTTDSTVGEATTVAGRAGARVFVVVAGQGGALQRARLQRLADGTGGSVLKVNSIPQLRRAFTQLARTLSRQYLLAYVSPLKTPEQRVRVNVRIDNATAATRYATPPTPPSAATKPSSFWFTTTGTVVLILGLIFVPVAAVVVIAALRGRRGPYG